MAEDILFLSGADLESLGLSMAEIVPILGAASLGQPLAQRFRVDPVFPIVEQRLAIGINEPPRLLEQAGSNITGDLAVGNCDDSSLAARIDGMRWVYGQIDARGVSGVAL